MGIINKETGEIIIGNISVNKELTWDDINRLSDDCEVYKSQKNCVLVVKERIKFENVTMRLEVTLSKDEATKTKFGPKVQLFCELNEDEMKLERYDNITAMENGVKWLSSELGEPDYYDKGFMFYKFSWGTIATAVSRGIYGVFGGNISVRYFMNESDAASELYSRPDLLEIILKSGFSCVEDDWQKVLWNDNAFFIPMSNEDHYALQVFFYLNGPLKLNLSSARFIDVATIKKALLEENVLDNSKLNELCQINPEYTFKRGGEYEYCPHLECFIIDRKKMDVELGTHDIFAAASTSTANDFASVGGGGRGFSDTWFDLFKKDYIFFAPSLSFSRKDVELTTAFGEYIKLNENELVNNTVSKETFADMKMTADLRAVECVENGTGNPSKECIENTGIKVQ